MTGMFTYHDLINEEKCFKRGCGGNLVFTSLEPVQTHNQVGSYEYTPRAIKCVKCQKVLATGTNDLGAVGEFLVKKSKIKKSNTLQT